jgi:hypothetical protein
VSLVRDRVVIAVAVAAAVALALAGCGVTNHSSVRRAHFAPMGTADPPAPHTPSVFAAVGTELELRSAKTGRVTKLLRRLGESWTNNGLAFAHNGRYVYFTLIPKRFGRGDPSLLLEQTSVRGRKQRLLARGEQPALSPDGALLAYVSGGGRSARISIRDLASGKTRSVNVWRLLGKNDILNASLAWLDDGTRLVVFEECCFESLAVATVRPMGSHSSSEPSGGDTFHLIVVSVPGKGELTARSIDPPGGMQMPESVGADSTRPDSLLTATYSGRGDEAVVDRLAIGRSRATLTRLLTIARAQVLGFDPSGRRPLYIVGHRPPNLWTATLENRYLRRRRLLIPNSRLGALAW